MPFNTTHAVAEGLSQLHNDIDDIESETISHNSQDTPEYKNDQSANVQEQFMLIPEKVNTESPQDPNIAKEHFQIETPTLEDSMTEESNYPTGLSGEIPLKTDDVRAHTETTILEEVLTKAIQEEGNEIEGEEEKGKEEYNQDIQTTNNPDLENANHSHEALKDTSSQPDELKIDDNEDPIDNEAFSKLLEFDSKNDHELFSTNDIPDEAIAKDNENKNDIINTETIEQQDNTIKDTDEKTRESTVKLEDNKQNNESSLSPHPTLSKELKQTLSAFTNTPEISLSPTNNVKDRVIVKPEDIANGESNLVQKLLMEKSITEQDQRKNSIIPGMFHTNDLHPQSIQLESISQHSGALSRIGNDLSPMNVGDPNSIGGTHQGVTGVPDEQPTIFAYARLDFQNFTFYVQTLHAIIGRRSENDTTHKVDVNLGPSKSISRRHAQIFYNFGTGRFELSIIGKNGAFVDDNFVERGKTVPLMNKTKIQIGQIPFQFVLPDQDNDAIEDDSKERVSDGSKFIKSTNKKAKKATTKKATVKKETTKKLGSAKKETTLKKETTRKKETTSKKEPATKKKTTTKPAVKKERKTAKVPKKVYTLEEIPEEYRTKPAFSYSAMLTTCIRKNSTEKGMSLSEIYAGIRELYPFYKYCPDGWQSSVRHNLSLNKSFRKVSKEGKGWLWGLDEAYIAEREQQKRKQAEAAKAKAEAAQARQEQQQQQKAKKATTAKTTSAKKQSISQTLAANRATTNNVNRLTDHQRTMKYLQGQLMILTKDRKGLSKQVIANILTQALAMTINQVTQAAKNKGISGNPLTALMDKNPKHLNLILAAAVNAATAKITNGKIKSLVSMTPPSVEKSKITTQQPNIQRPNTVETNSSSPNIKTEKQVQSSPHKDTTKIEPESESVDSSFDPTSLSRFFQPKQQVRVPPVSNTNPTTSITSITPQKRPLEDNSDESSDESTSSGESDSESDEEDDEDDEDDEEEEGADGNDDEEDEDEEDEDEEDEDNDEEEEEDGEDTGDNEEDDNANENEGKNDEGNNQEQEQMDKVVEDNEDDNKNNLSSPSSSDEHNGNEVVDSLQKDDNYNAVTTPQMTYSSIENDTHNTKDGDGDIEMKDVNEDVA